MDFQKHFETGWQNTMKHIGPLILLTLVELVLTVISFGILAPVLTAGYTGSLLTAMREGRTPEIGDLFSEMRLFFPLLLLSIAMAIVLSIGYLLVVIPGIVLTLLIAFGFLYVLPLMVDQELGLFDAIKESWQMSMEKPITDQIILSVIYMGLMSVGGSFMLLILFTQPFATFILLSVYEERLEMAEFEEIEDSEPPPFHE